MRKRIADDMAVCIRGNRRSEDVSRSGDRWRLPTDDEWREMATRYGGLGNDSPAKGKAAYTALLSGGTSAFNAVLGGNRSRTIL